MSSKTMVIWGRALEIEVVYERYDGEDVLPGQQKAYDEIIARWDAVDAALDDVKAYCLAHDGTAIGDNVFRLVMPRQLFIRRDAPTHVVALLCDYRLDEEHGLALIFENTMLKQVAPQDAAL